MLELRRDLKFIYSERKLGRVGLEPTETKVDGFTVHCNCHYATSPESVPPKGIEPSTIRLQVGRSTN